VLHQAGGLPDPVPPFLSYALPTDLTCGVGSGLGAIHELPLPVEPEPFQTLARSSRNFLSQILHDLWVMDSLFKGG
jgi:hypothetical protein